MYKYAPGLHGLLICFVMLGTACDKKPVAQTKQANQAQVKLVVASVNGENLYQDELDIMLQQYQQQVATLQDNEPDRQLVLNEMINSMLLIQHAKNAKIDQEPDVQAVLKRSQTEVLLQVVRHKILSNKPITNDEIKSRMDLTANSTARKSGKNDPLAEQQLRAQTFRALQKERIDELLKDLRGKAHIVVN